MHKPHTPQRVHVGDISVYLVRLDKNRYPEVLAVYVSDHSVICARCHVTPSFIAHEGRSRSVRVNPSIQFYIFHPDTSVLDPASACFFCGSVFDLQGSYVYITRNRGLEYKVI